MMMAWWVLVIMISHYHTIMRPPQWPLAIIIIIISYGDMAKGKEG